MPWETSNAPTATVRQHSSAAADSRIVFTPLCTGGCYQ